MDTNATLHRAQQMMGGQNGGSGPNLQDMMNDPEMMKL